MQETVGVVRRQWLLTPKPPGNVSLKRVGTNLQNANGVDSIPRPSSGGMVIETEALNRLIKLLPIHHARTCRAPGVYFTRCIHQGHTETLKNIQLMILAFDCHHCRRLGR